MATLQNIRNRGVLIAVIIGFALLAFIVGDFLNSGSTFFHQSRNVVGVVNGEKIKYEKYQALIEQLGNVYKIEYGVKELNDEMNSQIRKSVWESFVNEQIMSAEAEKIGLSVSEAELNDRIMGKNIHPLIAQRRIFADEKGQFSVARVLEIYKSVILNPNPQNDEEKQQFAELKEYWLFWEKAVKNSVLTEKYAALISKSTASNSVEAKYNYNASKETGDVSYVMQPYFSVSDSLIQVSNEELKARYEKDKQLFKQEANRSINYVLFEVTPLADDFKKAEEWNKKVSEEFKTTTDVENLVNTESDISYDGRNYSAQTVPANLKDFAFGSSTGAIFGPVFQNNTYTMAKIMESGIMESDSIKLSRIVVATEKTADSIITILNGGANFAEVVKKHSLDQQTAATGGELGWVPVKAAGAEIEEKAANKGAGELFKLTSAQGGTYIFKIDEKSPARRKVKLAILERKVTASDDSKTKIYNNAVQFAAASKDAQTFEKVAKEKGYIVHPGTNIDKNADQLNMIPLSREAVRWTYKNDKGDVSEVIECGTDNYIVATISEINEKGFLSLEKVTPQLKAEIIKDKKAEIISKNLSGLLAKNTSLDALAVALNTQPKVAPAINFNSTQFGEAGFEPYVIGKASLLTAGKISTPIKGNAGVYVILPAAKQVSTVPFNAKMVSMMMDARIAQSLPYAIIEKLREKYDIKDNRSNFY